MVKDNQPTGQGQSSGPESGEQKRQQSADMTQAGASRQQGSGQSYSRGAPQSENWQGGGSEARQQPPSAALQPRGSTASVSPSYGGFGSGPFSAMRRISDEMDRLFDSFGFGRLFPGGPGQMTPTSYAGHEATASLWSPHVEVSEREGKLVVAAELPGIKKEDVSVEVNSDSLVIQGQRRQENTSTERGYYHSERSYGAFYRTIPLPEGTDAGTASATFRDGVLQIEIQAPKQSRGRTLEIKGEDGAESRTSGEGEQRGSEQQR